MEMMKKNQVQQLQQQPQPQPQPQRNLKRMKMGAMENITKMNLKKLNH